MEKVVLFKTVHGSRLYGLAHSESDEDYYTVVGKVKTAKAKYSTHTIVGDHDSVVVDFGTWIDYCTKGVPQALEAMFSTKAEVDHIEAFRKGFVVGSQAFDRYLRTMKSFALEDSFKKKRHALRLGLNMRDIRHTGRFNPTLTSKQAALISRAAELPGEEVYETAKRLAWGG